MKKERPTGKSVVLFHIVSASSAETAVVVPPSGAAPPEPSYVGLLPPIVCRIKRSMQLRSLSSGGGFERDMDPTNRPTGIVRRVTGPETPLRSSESETERPSPTRIPENRKEARIRRLSAPETTPSKKRSARKRKRPETTIRIRRTALRVHAFPNESQKRTDTPKPTVPAA